MNISTWAMGWLLATAKWCTLGLLLIASAVVAGLLFHRLYMKRRRAT